MRQERSVLTSKRSNSTRHDQLKLTIVIDQIYEALFHGNQPKTITLPTFAGQKQTSHVSPLLAQFP